MPHDWLDREMRALAEIRERWIAAAAAQHAAFPVGMRVRFDGPGTWDRSRGFAGRTGTVVRHNEFGGVYVRLDPTPRARKPRTELVVRTDNLQKETVQ